MQKGSGAAWESRKKKERLFVKKKKKEKKEFILEKPHIVKEPHDMEQITGHTHTRNREERWLGEPG